MILTTILPEQANSLAVLLSLLEAGGDISINVSHDELGNSLRNAIDTVNHITAEHNT